jgi:hypothetical protein
MCLVAATFWLGLVVTFIGVLWIGWDTGRRWATRPTPTVGTRTSVGASEEVFSHLCAEITRFRDYEWHMTVWAITLLAAIIAVARTTTLPGDGQIIPYLQAGVGLIVVLFAVHVLYAHVRLSMERAVYRVWAGALGLQLHPARATGSLLDGMGHILSWIGLILLVAAAALYAISIWTIDPSQ